MKEDLLEGIPRPIIADIGSGDRPFPLANLLIDLYPDDNRHRPRGSPLTRDTRHFIQADVQDLPFPDKSIDFIWCSEVLEHVENPGKAVEEIKRVAKNAYILVPTMSREVICSEIDPEGWKTHLWYCYLLGNSINFVHKDAYDTEKDGIQVGHCEHVVIRLVAEE